MSGSEFFLGSLLLAFLFSLCLCLLLLILALPLASLPCFFLCLPAVVIPSPPRSCSSSSSAGVNRVEGGFGHASVYHSGSVLPPLGSDITLGARSNTPSADNPSVYVCCRFACSVCFGFWFFITSSNVFTYGIGSDHYEYEYEPDFNMPSTRLNETYPDVAAGSDRLEIDVDPDFLVAGPRAPSLVASPKYSAAGFVDASDELKTSALQCLLSADYFNALAFAFSRHVP
ncbi:hypothetical protein B0H14DRAFT_3590621 [Mycena olivaceomarginata]|nr:hypothetical protein B0H14DRAFT_3590621 [Mycena olivaceomarginata]